MDDAANTASFSTAKKLLFAFIVLIVIPIGFVCFLEGTASAFTFARAYRAARSVPYAPRKYVASDPLLGWTTVNGFSNPDEFGRGTALTISTDGFRLAATHRQDSSAVRVLCYGDSYTLGVGVSDSETWCANLESIAPGVASFNAGQDQYGVDQSYLRYKRDSANIPHHMAILALTEQAFERAISDNFQGRPKPLLNADLQLTNAPVPAASAVTVQEFAAAQTWSDLRLVQWYRLLRGRDPNLIPTQIVDERWPLFERMLTDFDSLSRSRGGEPVFVYLPTKRDLSARVDARRKKLEALAAAHHFRFVDLTPRLRVMRKDSIDLAFISNTAREAAPGTLGMYSRLGHAWVARAISSEFAAGAAPLPAFAPVTSGPGTR